MRTSRPSSMAGRGSVAALFFSLLMACGSSGPSGGTATAGTMTSGTGTGGTATGGGSCPTESLAGIVSFLQFVTPSAFETVGASFDAQPQTGSVDFGCHAACQFFPRDGGLPSDAGAFLDVGTVTVTDVTTSTNGTLMEEAGSDYFDMNFAWTAGDMLQIAGAGNSNFPAFSISFASPGPLMVTSPTGIAAKQTVMASQAAGLTVSWQPSSATFMSVGILSTAGEIDCFPADAAGTVTISPSMLSNIPMGTYPDGLSVARWITSVNAFGGKNLGLQAEEIAQATIQVGP